MSELTDLYQQIILDHNRRPRNFGKLQNAGRQARGHNPICGDQITVYVRVDGDLITGVAFEGSGCAISRASASLMTEAVRGASTEKAEGLFRRFQIVVTGDPNTPVDAPELGKLAALAGVRAFPARVKCATLPWHTLHAALSAEDRPVSTE